MLTLKISSVRTGGNDGSPPNPEPATKGIRMGLEAGTSTDLSSIHEPVSAFGQTMESRFTRIENQFTVMQATIVDKVLHLSTQDQHYMRSIASVLQRDVVSLWEIVNIKVRSSEQVLSSIIDYNISLGKTMENKAQK